MFLFGYAKNEAETLSETGRTYFSVLAQAYLQSTPDQIRALVAKGELVEIEDNG